MNRIGISTTLLVLAAACAAAGDRPLTTHRVPLERVASMDPLQSSAVYDSRAVSLVYEPLLEVDYEARPYRLKAGSCDLPKVSPDRLVYTFRLRTGGDVGGRGVFARTPARPEERIERHVDDGPREGREGR